MDLEAVRVAEYVSQMAYELSKMTNKPGVGTLSYLLKMVTEEATHIVAAASLAGQKTEMSKRLRFEVEQKKRGPHQGLSDD